MKKGKNNNQLGEQIRKLRKKKGLTIQELANEIGITKGYLSNLETGAVDNPSLKVLQGISMSLNVAISEILNPKSDENDSGISYGYHNIFDNLNKEKKKNQRKYRQAVTKVEDVLSDESIPEEKRKEIAEEVISLLERIESWLE